MRPARLAISAQERVVVGININEGDGVIFAQVLQERRQFFQLQSLARVNEQRRAREVPFTGSVQLRKNGNQIDRQIVDTIEAHVLERVQDGTLSGTGKAGEDYKLSCFAPRLRLQGGRSYAL